MPIPSSAFGVRLGQQMQDPHCLITAPSMGWMLLFPLAGITKQSVVTLDEAEGSQGVPRHILINPQGWVQH